MPLMLANWLTFLLTPLFLVAGVLLILVVLIQKGRGGGLVGAFSGIGSQTMGTKAGDVMTWITVGFATVFLLLAMLLTRFVASENTAVARPAKIPVPAAPAPVDPGEVPPPAPPPVTPAPAEKTPEKTDAKPAEKPADSKPAEKPADSKPAEKPAEKAPEKTEAKPEEKK
jgi:preprotein translocase subunit SecG